MSFFQGCLEFHCSMKYVFLWVLNFCPRLCPISESDCSFTFDSHVFWVPISAVGAAASGYISPTFWGRLLLLFQVGFVGKNENVLLDRASKAQVDALDLLKASWFFGDQEVTLASKVDATSVSDMETLVTNTMQPSTDFTSANALGVEMFFLWNIWKPCISFRTLKSKATWCGYMWVFSNFGHVFPILVGVRLGSISLGTCRRRLQMSWFDTSLPSTDSTLETVAFWPFGRCRPFWVSAPFLI